MVSLIVEIEALNKFFDHLTVPENLKIKLNRESLLKSSLFSARIEGATKKTEVDNIVSAYTWLERNLPSGKKINQTLVLTLHRKVLNKIDASAGHFRREMSAIFDREGNAVYLPPPPTEIKSLIGRLLNFANGKGEKFPLITAMLVHLIFEKIHPFVDGNGRVGRLLIAAVLKSRNYRLPLLVPFEEFLEKHRSDYYYFLDIGLKQPEQYLGFMLNAFLKQSLKTRNQLVHELKRPDTSFLSDRQTEIVNIIKDHHQVSLDFLKRRFFAVPSRTLRYDLKKLAEAGQIVKIGRTRGSFYRIKSD